MITETSKTIGRWIIDNLGTIGWSLLTILFLLSCFFKLTKKEIDPLGWVLSLIGKALTKDVRKDISDLKIETEKKFEEIKTETDNKIETIRIDIDRFEDSTNQIVASVNDNVSNIATATTKGNKLLKDRLDKMEKSNDMQTVRQIKAHVLDFANSCLNKHRHTKKDFDNIIKENEEYEKMVKKYRLKNDVYKEDFDFIMKVYHKCLEEGSFLKESDVEV